MKYKLLGKEEFDTTCQFCNKKQIGMSYVVELESGEIKRFGSTCVRKALKISSSDFKKEQLKEARAFAQKIYREFPCFGSGWLVERFAFKRFGVV